MKRIKGLLIALYFVLGSFGYAQGLPKEPVTVLSVTDGDTISVLYKGKQEKLRLQGIDAPEVSQGFWGEKSTCYLKQLLEGKPVTVQITGRDKYKRLLGYVYAQGQDINGTMVANGYSYAYLKYSYEFEQDERQAKSNCQGFWCKEDQPIYPWVYRHTSH